MSRKTTERVDFLSIYCKRVAIEQKTEIFSFLHLRRDETQSEPSAAVEELLAVLLNFDRGIYTPAHTHSAQHL